MTIRDAATVAAGATIDTDIAVVGGGAAGITLARELSGSGVDVVLLEAGGVEFDEQVQDAYDGVLDQPEGHDLLPLTASRLRFLGGTTNHWSGWCSPLHPQDFAARPWIADIGWPFGHEELARHYAQANEILEIGPFEYDAARIARDLDRRLLFAGDPILSPTLWRYSPPTRMGEVHRGELEQGTVDVILNAPVTGMATRGSRVTGLRAGRDGRTFRVRPRHVVLATGGIEVCRMLLALDDQEPGLALDRSGWLGRGWMEHPHVRPIGYVSVDESEVDTLELYTDEPEHDGVEVRAGIGLAPDVLAEESLLAPSVTLDTIDQDRIEELRLRDGVDALAGLLGPGSDDRILLRLYARTEQRPFADNRIELIDDRDAEGQRRVRLTWQVHDRDRRDLRRLTEILAGRFAAHGFGYVVDMERAATPVSIRGGNHHLGGTRMHESADVGVVDPNGRVHGVDNLWVSSSSVFPTGGFANPTLTIVALALRLAGRLREVVS